MTERTITMTAEGLDSLRTGIITVRATDNTGQPVVLFPQAAWESPMSRPSGPIAVLSNDDLDLIEKEPEGLVVVAVGLALSWRIAMAVAS